LGVLSLGILFLSGAQQPLHEPRGSVSTWLTRGRRVKRKEDLQNTLIALIRSWEHQNEPRLSLDVANVRGQTKSAMVKSK
jgi:hypothetical protein